MSCMDVYCWAWTCMISHKATCSAKQSLIVRKRKWEKERNISSLPVNIIIIVPMSLQNMHMNTLPCCSWRDRKDDNVYYNIRSNTMNLWIYNQDHHNHHDIIH